jgi:hypothetical protein
VLPSSFQEFFRRGVFAPCGALFKGGSFSLKDFKGSRKIPPKFPKKFLGLKILLKEDFLRRRAVFKRTAFKKLLVD